MDDAAAVRRAASRAVEAVEPEPLREALLAAVDDCSSVPGVMVLEGARAVDGSVEFERLDDRVVGVQLVYAGLRITRELATDPPWAAGGADAANLDVLAADILVARGAYLLAGTEASDTAVEVIRAFGRDQTRRETDAGAGRGLEADVFELSAVAGATAVGPGTPPWLLEWAAGVAASLDGGSLPEPGVLLAAGPPTGPRPVADDVPPTEDGRVTSSGDR